MRRSDWIIYAFFGFGMLVTAGFILLPAFHAIQLSFYNAESFISEPTWAGLTNYINVVQDPDFWSALLNGFIFSGSAISLQVILGIAIAMLLNTDFYGRRLVRGVSILPYLLPTVIVALTFQWMMDGSVGIITRLFEDMGFGTIAWFETPVAAMLSNIFVSVWLWTPFVTIAFLAGLQSVPRELYDAAKVDGTTSWQRFWHVTLPQLKPVLTVIVLLRGIWMFNKFDIVWLMTKGGPLGATEHLPILAYRRAFAMFDVGGGAAIATISFLILSAVVFIYFRLFPIEDKE